MALKCSRITLSLNASTSQMCIRELSDLQLLIVLPFTELLSKGGKLTTHDGKTVTDLFPEFRPGQVLRFSRLFGPAKASSMPQQWRNAKKRKKKKLKKQEDEKTVIEPPRSPPSPRPEDCMSDDEVNYQFSFVFFLWSL